MELKPYSIAVGNRTGSSFNRTKWNWNSDSQTRHGVPRAFNRTKWNWNKISLIGFANCLQLLIVLNGIETMVSYCNDEVVLFSFNRTKWNWNFVCPDVKFGPYSFNRTKWNWNALSPLSAACPNAAFNRTKWNWNNQNYYKEESNFSLLIVLNGIETRNTLMFILSVTCF